MGPVVCVTGAYNHYYAKCGIYHLVLVLGLCVEGERGRGHELLPGAGWIRARAPGVTSDSALLMTVNYPEEISQINLHSCLST